MRQIVFVTAFLGLSALHCSSNKPSGPAYPDAKAFCAGLAESQCNDTVVGACFGTTSSDKKTACIAKRERVCNDEMVGPAQDVGLTYDSAQAAACVDATRRAYGNAEITSTEAAEIASDCSSVFSRMGARNSVCRGDADCKRSDGLSCVIHPSGSAASDAGPPEGTCQSPSTPIPGGNSCEAPDAVCVTGYHCASSLHCIQDVAPPNPCNSVDVCASNARCSSEGICLMKLASGAECTSDEECLSGICLDGAGICYDSLAIAATDPFCTEMRQ